MQFSASRYLKFSALILAALAQPAAAGWVMDPAAGQPQPRAPAQTSRQLVRQTLTREASSPAPAFEGLVASHASANGLPASLVHRVIMRESGYNPHAVSAGNYGLMQIRLGTARAMGYSGPASGLLDAETNMTYAVRYLAGAYRAAGGNEARAIALYARGY